MMNEIYFKSSVKVLDMQIITYRPTQIRHNDIKSKHNHRYSSLVLCIECDIESVYLQNSAQAYYVF